MLFTLNPSSSVFPDVSVSNSKKIKVNNIFHHLVGADGLRNERGSILASLFSIFGGVLFVMLFFNLVRYVSAINAVSEAARRTARCLTPTDPDCVVLASNGEPISDQIWYGVREENRATEYADRYRYTASLVSEEAELPVSSYQTHTVRPFIGWTEFSIPVRDYSIEVNRFENRYVQPQMTAGLPRWRAEFSDFGSFDDATEEAFREADGWRYNGDLPSLWSGRSSQRIGVGVANAADFESPWLLIPALPGANPSATRVTQTDDAWNASVNYGGSAAEQLDWYSMARLAIKVQSEVLRVPGQGNAQAAWTRLRVRWCSGPDGTGSCDYRDLGGVSGIAVTHTTDPQFYNPYFRGPKGSHGGGTPGDHENIKVPRGSYIKFVARMEAELNPIDVATTIQIWFDNYSKQYESATRTCPEMRQCPSSDSPCPADPGVCGFAAGYEVVSCAAGAVTRTEPLCDNSGNSCAFAASTPILTSDKITQQNFAIHAASCGTYKPEIPTAKSTNRSFCLVDQDSGRSVISAELPGGCSLSGVSKVRECNEAWQSPTSNYGDASESCSWLTAAYLSDTTPSSINSAIVRQNSRQPNGAPKLTKFSEGNFKWVSFKEHTPPKWQPVTMLPVGVPQASLPSCGLPLTSIARVGAAACGDTQIFKFSRYQKLTTNPITLSDFNLPAGVKADSAAIMVNQVKVPINSVYPFQNPAEFEIANPDVTGNCRINHQDGDALNTVLRSYAAKVIPEAANSAYVFNGSATFVDTQVVGISAACGNPAFSSSEAPSCVRSVAGIERVECESPVMLGQYSSSTYPEGPAVCKDGTFSRCYGGEVESYQAAALSSTVNVEIARSRGFTELDRVFGPVGRQCHGSGCAEIHIDTESGVLAEVAVSYEMPLGFPLDTLLGAQTLSIKQNKKETQELKMLR